MSDASAPLGARQCVFLACLSMWSLRLAAHLTCRKVREGGVEDPRYNDYVLMFKRGQHHRALVVGGSLLNPFAQQALMQLLIGAPIIALLGAPGGEVGCLDAAALGLFVCGLVFEWGSDVQLAAFRAEPRARGDVLQTGFFAVSRHPNYFGDAAVHMAFWLAALAHDAQLAAPLFASPLLMFVLLRYVSGVELLDAELAARKPAYARYMATVPPFFPRAW